MNQWPVYETAKQHWRKTRTFLSEQEMKWQHPEATEEEIVEGMIEFNLAFEDSFQHEIVNFENITLPFEPTTREMVQENKRVRAELFKTLSRIKDKES